MKKLKNKNRGGGMTVAGYATRTDLILEGYLRQVLRGAGVEPDAGVSRLRRPGQRQQRVRHLAALRSPRRLEVHHRQRGRPATIEESSPRLAPRTAHLMPASYPLRRAKASAESSFGSDSMATRLRMRV